MCKFSIFVFKFNEEKKLFYWKCIGLILWKKGVINIFLCFLIGFCCIMVNFKVKVVINLRLFIGLKIFCGVFIII